MLPCSSIQRLERVVGTSSSSAGGGNSSSNNNMAPSSFVWNCIKDQDQLAVLTLCDSALWESTTSFLLSRPQIQIGETLAVAMNRATQVLVGLRQLGDEDIQRRAEEAANRARKKFASNNAENQQPQPNFVIETKFEPFASRCKRIVSSLCELVALRRFRDVILRMVDRDVSTASTVTEMFLAVSELLFHSAPSSSSSASPSPSVSLVKILKKLHKHLFSMILFLSSVKEKNSNTVATLNLMFNRSFWIGPHVERSSLQQLPQSATTNKKIVLVSKTSVIETILDLPENSGQQLLAALLKPIVDTKGARAAVYYDFNVALLTKNKVNVGEFTDFMNLVDGVHTKQFPPQKQLAFLSSVYLAFVSCEGADDYFQERKKAMIRNELAAAFQLRSSSSSNNKSSFGALLTGGNNKRESSVESVNTSSASTNNNNSANIRVSFLSHILIRMTKILYFAHDFASAKEKFGGGEDAFAQQEDQKSKNNKDKDKDKKQQQKEKDSTNSSSSSNNKIYESLSEVEKIDIAKSWWLCVQQLFESLQKSRGLVASDDLRYNNGFGFDSIFKLVKLLLLDTLDVMILNSAAAVAATTADKKEDGDDKNTKKRQQQSVGEDDDKRSAADNINDNNDDDDASSVVESDSGNFGNKDIKSINLLASILKNISSSFLLLFQGESNNNNINNHANQKSENSSSSSSTTIVVSSICKCLTCIGKLAPTHLMRFLPIVIRSLAKVQTSSKEKNHRQQQQQHQEILEFLCFSIEYLGKLNQCASFLKSLLQEVLSVINKSSKKSVPLLFSLLQHDSIFTFVQRAAAESLDAETILSVSTDICDSAAAAALDQESDDNKNISIMFRIARAIVEGVGANPVSGLSVTEQLVTAESTMSFAVASILMSEKDSSLNDDANNNDARELSSSSSRSVFDHPALQNSSSNSGFLEAVRFITSCRKKLFVVLQNAGVPSIDRLLISLNKTTWKFPQQIPLLFGSEEVSPSTKTVVKLLKKMIEQITDDQGEMYKKLAEIFCPLATSQLRLATIVSHLVSAAAWSSSKHKDAAKKKQNTQDDDQAEDDHTEQEEAAMMMKGFDILQDAGAQSLAKITVKQLRHLVSSSSSSSSFATMMHNEDLLSTFLDQKDIFLLRQLDPEGTTSLATDLLQAMSAHEDGAAENAASQQQPQQSSVATSLLISGSSIIPGTQELWKEHRGQDVSKLCSTSASASQKDNETNDNDEQEEEALIAKKVQALSENASELIATLLSSKTGLFSGATTTSLSNKAQKRRQIAISALSEAVKIISTRQTQLRQELIQACQQHQQSSASPTAVAFLKTFEYLLDLTKKQNQIEKDKDLPSIYAQSMLFSCDASANNNDNNDNDIQQQQSASATFALQLLLPLLIPLSATKLAIIISKAVEQTVAYWLRSSSTQQQQQQESSTITTSSIGSGASPTKLISIIVSDVLRPLFTNNNGSGTFTGTFFASSTSTASQEGFVRSAHLLLEASLCETSTSTFHHSEKTFIQDGLWLCKTAMQVVCSSYDNILEISGSNPLQAQLLVYILFLQKALRFGSQNQSRLIVRRVFEVLGFLFGDLFDISEETTEGGANDSHQQQQFATKEKRSATTRKHLQQLMQLHAPKFAYDILNIVSEPWMFSITSCAETLLRLSAVSLLRNDFEEEILGKGCGGDGSKGSIRSLILKWLCLDSEASTTLHETAISLLASDVVEGAERVGGGAGKFSIRRTGGSGGLKKNNAGGGRILSSHNTDANDFIYVALTNWPEAQLRLKSLHLEAHERI